MGKIFKRSILALALAAIVLASGIFVSAAGHAGADTEMPQAVAFFLHPIIEGS